MELKYDQTYTIISKRDIDKAINLNSHLLCCLVMQAALVSIWTDQKAGLHAVRYGVFSSLGLLQMNTDPPSVGNDLVWCSSGGALNQHTHELNQMHHEYRVH
jgi:hypothetical protein